MLGLAEPKLAGRQQELEDLQRFLHLACEGNGTTILISGEAGSGKTRLAKEFLEAAMNEATVLSGWCLSNAAIPYFPFVEAFDSYSSSSETQIAGSETQRLKLKKWLMGTTQSGVESENLNRQTWKDQTFASVTRELLLLSAQRPVVVFIDDIQWADSASLSLLQYLSRAITYERILILATFRSEELGAQLEAQSQALAEILPIMRREDLYKEIKLTNLSDIEVGQIAESMLCGEVNKNLVERLASETYGNPLFVIESLKMFAEQRGLVQENGCWNTVEGQFGIPSKVRDVILRRLNSLNLEARNVLDAGAVIGDKFDSQLIGAVLDQSTIRVLSILNSISKSKSLVCCEQDWYRFDHPKTREILYEEISPPLRKEYHLRIAEKLEAVSSSNSAVSSADLAYHYVNSGNKQKAINYSIEAGKTALARFSNAEAMKHFNYVLSAIEDDSSYDLERVAALEGLGDACYANMRFTEAIRAYRSLSAIEGSAKVRALRKAMDAAFFQNSTGVLKTLLKEVEGCAITEPLEKARILMNKARATSKEPRKLPLALEYFEQALKLAEEQNSLWDVGWILIGFGSTLPWSGQREKALAALLRSIAVFRELGDFRWLIEAYNATGTIIITHFGLWQDGVEFLKKASEVNAQAKVGDYMRLAQLTSEWGRALAFMGDLNGALAKSLEALDYSEKTDSDWAKGTVYASLTMFYGALGEVKQAETYFEKLTSLSADVLKNVYVNASVAKAVLFASQNKWFESNQLFITILDGLALVPSPAVEANLRVCFASVLEMQGKMEPATQQRSMARDLYECVARQLSSVTICAGLMHPVTVSTDQSFEIRLDLVNVSKCPGLLLKVKGILSSEFKVSSIPQGVTIRGDEIQFEDQTIERLAVRTIKLSLQASKMGVYSLNPQIIYTSGIGENKTSNVKTETIHVASAPVQLGMESKIVAPKQIRLNSDNAEKIFAFLIKSFREDYLQRKMPQERSGWRSLMDIVRGGKISRYSVYGFPSSQGQAMAELQREGLAEVRVFEGERGRGGRIVKARICFEKETIKSYVNK